MASLGAFPTAVGVVPHGSSDPAGLPLISTSQFVGFFLRCPEAGSRDADTRHPSRWPLARSRGARAGPRFVGQLIEPLEVPSPGWIAGIVTHDNYIEEIERNRRTSLKLADIDARNYNLILLARQHHSIHKLRVPRLIQRRHVAVDLVLHYHPIGSEYARGLIDDGDKNVEGVPNVEPPRFGAFVVSLYIRIVSRQC